MSSAIQLPAGYEDAKSVASSIQLPAGYEDATPVNGTGQTKDTFLGHYWNQVNPISGLRSMGEAMLHPIDTLRADAAARQEALDQAKKDLASGNLSRLLAAPTEILNASVPFLGPQNENIGKEVAAKQYGPALGDVAGIATNFATPEIAAKAKAKLPNMSGAAERLYRSALKPSTVADQAKVSSAIQTGLENKIPVSPRGLETLSDLIDDVNDQIANRIQSNPNAPVNKFAVASRLGKTAQEFSNQVNPTADLEAIGKSGNEFLDLQPNNIPASTAQAIKQGTYQQLRKKYGQLGSADVEAQKALARGIKEEIATQFPGINDLNAQDSKLINLDGLLDRAVARISNHQIVGIGTPLATAGAKAVTGSNAVAGVSGLLKAVVDDPVIKSHMAIALSHASGGTISLPAALARLAAYSDALGNSANNESQPSQ